MLPNTKLVSPSADYKQSFIEAVKEYQADTAYPLMSDRYRFLSIQELESDFEKFAAEQASRANGENLPRGWVPETIYWLVEGNDFIGRVSIRPHLTEELRQIGGHIGYDIRPTKRQRGYGKALLALALPKAKELGITRALLTCDETNIGSRKIIEQNGGVFENKLPNPTTGIDKLRFWIATQ